MEPKIIQLSEIKIKDAYEKQIPNPKKFCKKLAYYKRMKKFDKPIVINSKNVLLDGYVNYLIAKMLKIKEVEVATVNKLKKRDKTIKEEYGIACKSVNI